VLAVAYIPQNLDRSEQAHFKFGNEFPDVRVKDLSPVSIDPHRSLPRRPWYAYSNPDTLRPHSIFLLRR
jgi:hypothetical protein